MRISSSLITFWFMMALVVTTEATNTSGKCASDAPSLSASASTVLDQIRSSWSSRPFPKELLSDYNDKEDQGGDDGRRRWTADSPAAHACWSFLSGLAGSKTFVEDVWQKRPLLWRSSEVGGWASGAFTVRDDLQRGIEGSYISGHRTADALRAHSSTSAKSATWEFTAIKSDPARPSTWKEVEEALEGGTVYFNTAGGLWPTVGALCVLANAAFGLPSNVNIYATPPHVRQSVPAHTDRQDVLVCQTEGSKRWRVYAPPARGSGAAADPLNRGKAGDVLDMSSETPLIDTVLRRGDVLYVPAGFPHTTDTVTVVDNDGDQQQQPIDLYNETSVHLTLGLDTHVWGLTYAHLRWSLLQRCGTNFRLNIQDDDLYWRAMKTSPLGFLTHPNDEDDDKVTDILLNLMRDLEPHRWRKDDESGNNNDNNDDGLEDLPNKEMVRQVWTYVRDIHLRRLLDVQQGMYSNVDPHDESTLFRAYSGTQNLNKAMEDFAKFSKNTEMEENFRDIRERRDLKATGASIDRHRLP